MAAAPDPDVPPYTAVPPPLPERKPLPFIRGRIPEIVSSVRDGFVNPEHRIRRALRHAHNALDLNAFINLDDQLADTVMSLLPGMKDPEAPLAGVILGIKDLIEVKGLPITGGSNVLPPRIAQSDATSVSRLRKAGALFLGTTNMHELAYGITSQNPHFGTVGNPAAPGRISGGSSGGSAAAVAAGIVDAALGTDTAGSIRIPAACCGVVGFKPSYGLIPTDGVMALGWSLDHIGPLTQTVEDAHQLFHIMARTAVVETTSISGRRSGKTLIIPAGYFCDHLAPPVRACMDRAFQVLENRGFSLIEIDIPYLEYAAGIQFVTLCVEAYQNYQTVIERSPEGLGEDVRVRLEIGQFITGADYLKAQRLRELLRRAMVTRLANADAFIMPTMPITAPALDTEMTQVGDVTMPIHTAMTRCTAPFNLTGMPAITLPCGRDHDGAPVGLQLAGRPGGDVDLLSIAQLVESEIDSEFIGG